MSSEYYDVVIIGAGLSGIGAACHLKQQCPDKSFILLESRQSLGGTWDLFRYPGIRSDSDMHTFGYDFKPWRQPKSIADGPSILEYIRETAEENGILSHIRYGQRVKVAAWSSERCEWIIDLESSSTKTEVRGNLLLICTGYYSYEQGYTPAFSGVDDFHGPVIHPQHWPEDVELRDKRIVVIGSGATAMTLIPSIAKDAQHVTMLQRSPTYVVALPAKDKIAKWFRRFLPERMAYALTRWKNITLQQFFYQRMRKHPQEAKERLIGLIRKHLGDDFDVEKHFTPTYDPWDQRVCVVPDGDFFRSIRSGKASVVTEAIDKFTNNGILLKTGELLPADLIITATGLNLQTFGGIHFEVDGQPIDFSQTYTYKGIMFSGVPNLIFTFGYINASWTLRADLTSYFTCRLIKYMSRHGYRKCVPELRLQDRDMTDRPFLQHFTPGYVTRSLHQFPKQGDQYPWINPQNYKKDKQMLKKDTLNDGVLRYSKSK